MKTVDLAGKRFGRLTVLKRSGFVNGHSRWICLCDCGNTTNPISISNLRSGNTQSCGCLVKEGTHRTHGLYYTRLHRIWNGMKNRCNNESQIGFKNYGGKGIKVCNEWQSFQPFHEWAMQGGYSDELTIDRKDNSKGYCPDNCRWATRREQSNNRSNTINKRGLIK